MRGLAPRVGNMVWTMAKYLFRKQGDTLRAVDERSVQGIGKIKNGDLVTVEVKRPRNPNHHRLYWALVSKVWENVDERIYPTPETLHAAIKVATGHRTPFVLPDGTQGFIPDSIAFHKMDQTQFDVFFDRVVSLVCEYFIPGLEEDDLKREVLAMVGERL